jgi:hypothetical protein
LFTSEETETLRQRIIEACILPQVERAFQRHPELQSAAFGVEQFYCDEAHDAVQQEITYSVLTTPDLKAHRSAVEGGTGDTINLPGLPALRTLTYSDEEDPWWPDNNMAIPAFAAFCSGAYNHGEIHVPHATYAVLRRGQVEIEVNVVGEMVRPWLDGVNFEWNLTFTVEQAAEVRAQRIKAFAIPRVRFVFDHFPEIQSAVLFVAGYEPPFEFDLARCRLAYSVLAEPNTEAARQSIEQGNTPDATNLPGSAGGAHEALDQPIRGLIHDVLSEGYPDRWKNWYRQDDTKECPKFDLAETWIPPEHMASEFADYCEPGSTAERPRYTPYALFVREEAEIPVKVVGTHRNNAGTWEDVKQNWLREPVYRSGRAASED